MKKKTSNADISQIVDIGVLDVRVAQLCNRVSEIERIQKHLNCTHKNIGYYIDDHMGVVFKYCILCDDCGKEIQIFETRQEWEISKAAAILENAKKEYDAAKKEYADLAKDKP